VITIYKLIFADVWSECVRQQFAFSPEFATASTFIHSFHGKEQKKKSTSSPLRSEDSSPRPFRWYNFNVPVTTNEQSTVRKHTIRHSSSTNNSKNNPDVSFSLCVENDKKHTAQQSGESRRSGPPFVVKKPFLCRNHVTGGTHEGHGHELRNFGHPKGGHVGWKTSGIPTLAVFARCGPSFVVTRASLAEPIEGKVPCASFLGR